MRQHVQCTPRRLFYAAALVLGTGLHLYATVVPRYSFEELVERSTRIVHARCVATDSYLEAGTGTIWTRNHFQVLDSLRGDARGLIVVTEPGGMVGVLGQWVPGAPQFTSGDEVVLFLSRTESGKWRVFGWGQGNFRVRRDTPTDPPRVRADLSGIELADPAGTETPARRTRAAGLQTLDEFKARVRDHLNLRGLR